MAIETLYQSEHPHITITHDDESGDVTLIRTDRYMRNPDTHLPTHVPLRVVLINTKEGHK